MADDWLPGVAPIAGPDQRMYCPHCGAALDPHAALRAYCASHELEVITAESWRTMVADSDQARRYRRLPATLRRIFG